METRNLLMNLVNMHCKKVWNMEESATVGKHFEPWLKHFEPLTTATVKTRKCKA